MSGAVFFFTWVFLCLLVYAVVEFLTRGGKDGES